MFELTAEERDRRWQKVRGAMAKRGLGALVISGSFSRHSGYNAHLRYLSNANIEGYLVFPLEGEPTLVIFLKHARSNWVTKARTGHPIYSKAISDALKELHLESGDIGIVGLSGYFGEMGFPYTTYMALTHNLSKARFSDATDILEDARRVKGDAEIRCLELGCEAANKAIEAVANTAKAGVKNQEVILALSNTLFRNECEPNAMILYCSGKEMTHAGGGARGTKSLEEGDIILAEFDAQYNGYIAQHNQPFSVGEPGKEWREISRIASESFQSGFNALKPGITVGELDKAFLEPIKESGYNTLNPSFHCHGLSLEEPISRFPGQPNYVPKTSFKMEAGMVVTFEPHVITPDLKKGLSLGCPVLVTEVGCRLLNKGWKPQLR